MRTHCKLALVCVMMWCGLASSSGQTRMRAESGIINLTAWDYENDFVALEGYWKFYSKTLIRSVAEIDTFSTRGTDYLFPALWNDVRADGSGKGFGTYSLKIILPKGVDSLSLEIPQLYNAYKLSVDDKVIASVGTVGTTDQETKPHWVHRTATFATEGKDTVHLLLQISNFHHAKGGIKGHIYLGTPEKVKRHFIWEKTTNVLEAIVLCVLGVGFLVFYVRNKQLVNLMFALLCITWAVRAVFSNLYLIAGWFPEISWGLMVRIEYLTLYFAMIWAALFLYQLFRNIGSNLVLTYILVFLNLLFALFTIVASTAVFTKSVSLYLLVAAVTIVYAAVMVIRALFTDAAGAWFLMASILTGGIMFGYDIITYQTTSTYNFIFLNIGYIVMFILVAIGLLFHLNILKQKDNSNMLRYEDMFGK